MRRKKVLILPYTGRSQAELEEMLGGMFGQASATVVIEEFLSGIECSVFVLTDSKNYKVLPVAKDYKRIGEGDKGLNTGGMGSVTPVPLPTRYSWKRYVPASSNLPSADCRKKTSFTRLHLPRPDPCER